jgi:SAM-dependent methyltransferase
MYIRYLFRRYFRQIVPLSWYPVLAIPYRWIVRRTIARMAKEDEAYRREHPETIAPPPRLRLKVVGFRCSITEFLQSGERTVSDLEEGLKRAGRSFTPGLKALDLGCGCGRTILAFRRRWPTVELAGADIDAEAIGWCRGSIIGVDFLANDAIPPLPYAPASFDLAWTVSVFTHLDEERQFAWLKELQRIVKPGGLLIATVHGRKVWEGLPRPARQRIQRRGFHYAMIAADRGLHPEWYQVAWHTEEYVRRNWTSFFDLRCYLPEGLGGSQDMIVLERAQRGGVKEE